MNIGIIGAGPAGIAAALQAAWQGHTVTVFERNSMIGRKLLITGSGRCNISNDSVAATRYVCSDPAWMETLLAHFGVADLMAVLREVGILTTKTTDGWYYPLSDSAHTVADALLSALKLANVELQLDTRVVSIRAYSPGFALDWQQGTVNRQTTFDAVVIAAGGAAYPNLGSRAELFPVLAGLGHTVHPKRPALAPVLANLGELKALQGVRLDLGVQVWSGSQILAEAAGNSIFTDWGMNGPAVMDVSYAISSHPDEELTLRLNFLHFVKHEFAGFLAEKRSSPIPVRNLLGAFFTPKVNILFLKMARINGSTPLDQLDESALQRLIQLLRDYRLPILGVRGFEFCQVSIGGVPVEEVNPLTLESKLIPGLFLVGETVDVVGPCGGYNLHYAFASGSLAGLAIGKPK